MTLTRKPASLLGIATLATLSLAAPPPAAAGNSSTTFTFNNVTFYTIGDTAGSDDGTITGSFVLDPTTSTITSFDITASAFGSTPARHYSPSLGYTGEYGSDTATNTEYVRFYSGDDQLDAFWPPPLGGGPPQGNTNIEGGGEEYQGNPLDIINAQGSITVGPEPSSVAAFACTGLGALGLILKARRRRADGT